MTYLLPPLNALRAFEAAARHLSFKLAAQELHVTAGAVAQQVKGLETRLGLKLFDRLHRQLILTAAGESYLQPLRDALRTIADATTALRPDGIGAVVTLGLPNGFALARIEAARHQMAPFLLRVLQPAGLHELAEGKVDALVGRSRHPGYRASPLSGDELLLCSEGTADCPELDSLRAALVTPRRSPGSPAARASRASRRSSPSIPARLRPARAAE